ncbi:GYD domain-containing protein [Streptomyces sp. NPDC058612]|uniref:GYD domain-containing protein n=1 Tax=Streptomyces sp. NPDC058612 TaxID=3346555 RepID=UPI003655EFD1
MPLYLSRFSYTPGTWARLIVHPEDRAKAAQAYIESVGGKLHGFWYAFGRHDGYNLWEAPDNVSMAAVALAIGGGGAPASIANETSVKARSLENPDVPRSQTTWHPGSSAAHHLTAAVRPDTECLSWRGGRHGWRDADLVCA